MRLKQWRLQTGGYGDALTPACLIRDHASTHGLVSRDPMQQVPRGCIEEKQVAVEIARDTPTGTAGAAMVKTSRPMVALRSDQTNHVDVTIAFRGGVEEL